MRFSIKTIAALLATITPIVTAAASNADAVAPTDSDVVKLGAENFESFLEENPLVLVEFFAPWCGHCKALGPEYVEAASQLKDKNIPLVQIDCTEEEELCQGQGIRGYPTIKIFRGADDAKPYEGARKADAISSYMIKQSLPAVQVGVDSKALETIIADVKEPVILQVLPKDEKTSNETYIKIADAKREKFTFLSTDNKEVVKKFSATKPTYVVYRSDFKEGDEPAVFSDDITAENLEAFISTESMPLFGEINGETFQDYMNAKQPLAYLFYSTPEEQKEWTSKMTKLAKEYRGKVNFVGLDASRFGKHAENLNQEEVFPLFAIHDLTDNKKFGLDQTKDLTLENIEELLKDFEAGNATPKIKSEEIPETQENAVFKLVAYTHDEIINDDAKDVLVMYHATWCGHCKRLAPVYEELAAIYQNDENASGKVVIANIEATQNDVNVDIQGFPTLILYPAGDKSNPIHFEQSRDLETLAEFIKDKGTNKIDGLALKKALEESEEAEDNEEEEEKEDVSHDEL
ncbi:protein disulfide isomerase [Saccharomycopsis crataegensis]|uniref:Protein disulfide-isomerase n=1 Tax=Saccharomycopsis crataegensis TaxID=43959 RepID=A0AAV5QJF6_9ASCO|nr:protein disulfide isomerase [Saccharomycopsis crataegensis]